MKVKGEKTARHMLLELLRTMHDGTTPVEVATLLNIRVDSAYQLLIRMGKAGEIIRLGTHRRACWILEPYVQGALERSKARAAEKERQEAMERRIRQEERAAMLGPHQKTLKQWEAPKSKPGPSSVFDLAVM